LQQLAADAAGLHLQLRFAGSFDALQSLAEGRCVVAGFHVPRGVQRGSVYAQAMRPLLRPGRHKLLACMQRQQGLMVAAGNALDVTSLADVVQRRLRFADREPGAGTHVLTDHLLQQAHLERSALQVATTENSHVAAALAVASGRADAALGLQAAAEQAGLGFVPLVEEDYFLVCLRDALDTPAVLALRQALALSTWRHHLSGLAGYTAAADAGAVRALVQVLPWWSFKRPAAPAS
jgi:putative molybdopterin biosynthesis protein